MIRVSGKIQFQGGSYLFMLLLRDLKHYSNLRGIHYKPLFFCRTLCSNHFQPICESIKIKIGRGQDLLKTRKHIKFLDTS